jgi:hypothetical protein
MSKAPRCLDPLPVRRPSKLPWKSKRSGIRLNPVVVCYIVVIQILIWRCSHINSCIYS